MSDKTLTGYPSIDKPWLSYYDCNFAESDIPNMSIYQLALESNKKNMNKVAIDLRSSATNYSMGIKITYKEFFEFIQKTAKASYALGIGKYEIIPLILPNIPEARILIYANSVLGAVSYPISPLLPANQLKDLIVKNEIKNVFIFKMFLPKYLDVLKSCNIKNIILLDGTESVPAPLKAITKIKTLFSKEKNKTYDKNVISWGQYQEKSKSVAEEIKPFYEENHVTAIIGTSGTTGTPKGVCLTDRNINTVALAYKNGKLLDGTMMDALLPSIGYGISMLHYQTVAGKYVYLIPELLTTTFADVLCKLHPDNFAGGPVHFINLRASKQFKNGMLPKFQNLISGGASLPRDVERALNQVPNDYEEVGVNQNLIVRQGYGLSENVAMGTYSKHGAYKFGSIGIPAPYITISIFESGTDKELKYNEHGEICITGPSVMAGYLNNKEETDKVLIPHSDGKLWIHTKDIGYMDEKGHIFHVDRIKNIFMRTGFNVHPTTIADYINTIPFVKNSVVIGFEHPEEQSVPIAFVEVENTNMTNEEMAEKLQKECFEALEETSVPYAFVFVDELPINVGGKIDIQRIREMSKIDLMHSSTIIETLSFKVGE